MQLKIFYRRKTIPTEQDVKKMDKNKSRYLDILYWKSPVLIVLLPLLQK
jgi:hypothetical protein